MAAPVHTPVHKVDISWERRSSGNVAHLVYDNASKLNALSPPALLDLTEAFLALAREEDLRCVVFSGAGGKAFAVYVPESEAEFAQNDALLQAGRVHGYGPCDYAAASFTPKWIRHALAAMVERLAQERQRSVAARVTRPPRHLRQQLKRPLPGPEVRHAKADVCRDHADQRDAREVMALRDHLGADEDVEIACFADQPLGVFSRRHVGRNCTTADLLGERISFVGA